MEQGRSTRTPGRKLAAIAVTAACLLGRAGGGAGGDRGDAAARAACCRSPASGGGERARAAQRRGRAAAVHPPGGADRLPGPDRARSWRATALGCVDGSPLLIICDAAQITRIELDLGDGRDYVDASELTLPGADVDADLGPGDDFFTGGPLREQVSDGRGTDRVSADSIVQPDVADPATMDGGDVLEGGTISYAARRRDVGVTVTLDDAADDGAPGELDRVKGTGVNGTQYADIAHGLGRRRRARRPRRRRHDRRPRGRRRAHRRHRLGHDHRRRRRGQRQRRSRPAAPATTRCTWRTARRTAGSRAAAARTP